MTDFYNCDLCEGGKPLCRLPLIKDERRGTPYVKNIQIMGARADEILNNRRRIRLDKTQYDVMVVAEMPGIKEDEAGMPFHGKSGGILCEFLQKADFDLDKVYVTTMAKCRTPDNRRAAAAEIEACKVHLQYEFNKYKPKLVILLGNPVLKLFNLDKAGGMKHIHGKVFIKKAKFLLASPDFIVIPTYHPATFLVRDNPALKKRVLDDYRVARHALSIGSDAERPYYQAKYKLCETVEDVADMVAQVKAKKIFAWDTESPDLRFWSSPMVTVQISIGKDKTWVVPFYRHDPTLPEEWTDFKLKPQWNNEDLDKVKELLRSIFEDETIVKSAHTAHYDINVVRRWIGCQVKGWIWDIILMHRLLDENSRDNDLKFLADLHYGVGDYSQPVRKITGSGKNLTKTWDNVPDGVLHPYGATDGEVSFRLMEDFYKELIKAPHLIKFYKEEIAEGILSYADIEYCGNKIDVEVTKQLIAELEKEIEDIVQKARAITTPTFNPNSHPQVVDQFIKLGFTKEIAAPTTASGYSTDKATLEDLDRDVVPLAGLVVDYRNRVKMLSTYADVTKRAIDTDGRARFRFRPFMTTTARSSAQLLHQVPGIDEDRVKAGQPVYRDMFIAEPGYSYVYFDYSQIELWVVALVAGETKLLNELLAGLDPHRIAAATCLGIPESMVSDRNRTAVGKKIGFGSVYGSTGYAMSQGVFDNPETGKTETIGERAYVFAENYRKVYSRIGLFLESVPEIARHDGNKLFSVFGLERRLPELSSKNRANRGHAEREAVNFKIQSPASSIMKRTLNMLCRVLREQSVGFDIIKPLNEVHDSGAFEVRNDYVDWFVEVVRAVAGRPIAELQNQSFKCKIGVGRSWTEAELNAK